MTCDATAGYACALASCALASCALASCATSFLHCLDFYATSFLHCLDFYVLHSLIARLVRPEEGGRPRSMGRR